MYYQKGCFPETFDVQDKFAFISLDVDFYDTVKNSLEKYIRTSAKGDILWYMIITICRIQKLKMR